MCGRFTLSKPAEAIADELGIDAWNDLSPWLPGYNIAPTRETPVILQAPTPHLHLVRWGLVPAWSKDLRIGSRMINARAETLTRKRSFKNLIATQRCAIIIEGYYEWQKRDKAKIPHFIHREDGALITLAGLWDAWLGPDDRPVLTYTIVTTTPTDDLAHLHDRMPVILQDDARHCWLSACSTEEEALATIRPNSSGLTCRQVSTYVNNVRNEGPQCVDDSFDLPLFQ